MRNLFGRTLGRYRIVEKSGRSGALSRAERGGAEGPQSDAREKR
jgi:hypothetical protein